MGSSERGGKALPETPASLQTFQESRQHPLFLQRASREGIYRSSNQGVRTRDPIGPRLCHLFSQSFSAF